MSSISVALDALDAAVELLGAADVRELCAPERFAAVDRLETALRRQIAISREQLTHLEQYEGCPPVGIVLADMLRISRREAKRRLGDAGQLAPRTTLTGEQLPPLLPATAKAWDAGLLDLEHLRVIQKFFRELPDHVPPAQVEKAERSLAEHAQSLRPDQLEKVAARLATHLNPDGTFSEEDRARKRGFVWCGGQRPDGMSVGRLVADPELRAMLDAWLAKFAAPGMCNPDGGDGQRDLRGHGQRQHDALAELVRGRLGDPKLGQHNGLPVTVIVTATVQDLQAKTGHAVTAGGTLIPMSDVIRMATPAYNYLAVFDGVTGKSLWLGRKKRLASAEQRIMLLSKERGCTAPGCTVRGYDCQVHHAVTDWNRGGNTDIDDLTLACKRDNLHAENDGWGTRKLPNGHTEWIPPPGVPLIGGTNSYHHPERLLPDDGDEDDP
ncbi:HNH endonuclease signature motif containing protein [Candidatus Mycolicibacterium alkanivorans]|uniref:HNH endonuclease n=1 Tax=Candidatus Mycolicibacterium alkanivorans TaxID=2954114 RepID=A0ABS9YYQ5_9MYCO|nr:HNH endonuclease signature motif containing protein [Candidatus Mycolicibacterium alkanivorans]MCI4675459.1 HNH endonuclease [Candidatus Mycolicibacterium alkanivorans]